MSDKRERKILRLRQDQAQGDIAEQQLKILAPLLEGRQAKYVAALIANTRDRRGVAEAEVWKLVALDDVRRDLEMAVRDGRIAQARLDKQSKPVIGGDDGG